MYSCLSKVPIFQHLSAAEMEHVHQFIRPKTYQKGEFIQHAGDTTSQLLVLNRGSAKVLRTSPDGSEVIVKQLQPGDYIGDTAVFGDLPADNDTVATTDASFCTLSGSNLHELLRSYPTLSIKIIGDLSVKLKNSQAHIESLSLKTAQDRVYEALIGYADGNIHTQSVQKGHCRFYRHATRNVQPQFAAVAAKKTHYNRWQNHQLYRLSWIAHRLFER